MIREITEDDYRAVQFIAKNMRERDWEEISATARSDDPLDLADGVMALGGLKYIVFLGEEPVACFGAAPQHPGVFITWLFGTDRFAGALLGVTRFIRRVMIPALVAQGAHRAHCLSLASYTKIHDWIYRIGGRKEGVKKRYGKNREDFVEFVWSVESCAAGKHPPKTIQEK